MKNFRFILTVLILGSLAIFLNACGGGIEQPTSITVTPDKPIIPVGITQQFTASGTFAAAPGGDITKLVTWSSSNTSVAIVNSNGVATALTAGTTTITATSGSVSESTTLTVTSATLSSIAVTPAKPSIPGETTQQFTATATFSDGATHDVTTQVTWNSSNPFVATVDTNGLATAIAAGIATIKAISGTVSGSTTLTVTSATLSSIAVTPANPAISIAATQQFTATATFSDGTTHDITAQVTWSSSNTAVADVTSNGLATAIAAGTVTITATSGAVSGSTTLTVTSASPSSISLTPANPVISVATTQQFTATATFSDGTTRDISTQVTWSSSNPFVATVSSNGLATAIATGTATITATSGTASGSTTLTVTSATVSSIAVTPANLSIPAGTTQQFTATAIFSDLTTHDITTQVTWISSSTTVAVVNSNGLATAMAAGTATITATSGTVSGSTTLTVSLGTLSSIILTPPNPAISLATSQQFTATATFSDGTTRDITTQVTWSSSNPFVATVNSNGRATALTAGTTTITASFGNISANTTLTVT